MADHWKVVIPKQDSFMSVRKACWKDHIRLGPWPGSSLFNYWVHRNDLVESYIMPAVTSPGDERKEGSELDEQTRFPMKESSMHVISSGWMIAS